MRTIKPNKKPSVSRYYVFEAKFLCADRSDILRTVDRNNFRQFEVGNAAISPLGSFEQSAASEVKSNYLLSHIGKNITHMFTNKTVFIIAESNEREPLKLLYYSFDDNKWVLEQPEDVFLVFTDKQIDNLNYQITNYIRDYEDDRNNPKKVADEWLSYPPI